MKTAITDVKYLCTSYSVEGSDHQHEDGGQVQVPSQTHLNKQGSRVQVRLVAERQHICQHGHLRGLRLDSVTNC